MLCESGTNKVSGGLLPGPGSLQRASLTSFSMLQVIAPTMQELGRIVSGAGVTFSSSKALDRASGFMFQEPGL